MNLLHFSIPTLKVDSKENRKRLIIGKAADQTRVIDCVLGFTLSVIVIDPKVSICGHMKNNNRRNNNPFS